jgi:hypothetical protein
VEYTLELLLGKDFRRQYPRAKILYQEAKENISGDGVLYIIPSDFFDEQYVKVSSLPVLPLKEVEGIPLLFGSPRIERQGNQLVVHADIIASTFFLVTRYEEIVRRDVRDEHGRFLGKESLPYRAGFIDRPIVEDYAGLLRKWLLEVGVDIGGPKRDFSVVLTHDVDNPQKYWRISQPLRQVAKAFLGREPFSSIIDSIVVPFGLRKDPYDTFEELAELADSFGEQAGRPEQQSIYFFRAGGSSKYDRGYDIHKTVVQDIIKRVHTSGATVGLHTSYNAGLNPELIEKEKLALEEVCGFKIRHNRHHYLAWREVEDGWALSRVGIKWDSTLGYADVSGFRLGVCRPIELFDPIRMEPFGIEEHPLIIMDGTLSEYMNCEEDEAFEYCRRLIAQTRKHNGEFVMLWHNDRLARGSNSYHPRLYRKLLEELSAAP